MFNPHTQPGRLGRAPRRLHIALLSVALLAAAGAAGAVESGRTAAGVPFASGGVSSGELSALHRERENYSLWVVTAAAKSGAFLADVRVRVRDGEGRLVFDDRMAGPWLFIDLPLGRYEVEAQLDGNVQRHVTTVHRGDHHQMFFYFDTGDEVSPDRPDAGLANPYDGPRAQPLPR